MKDRQSFSYLPFLIGYIAFVVYGSLVPLHFRYVAWVEAVERFRELPYLRLGIHSRADWVANILLFIPLGFLSSGYILNSEWVGRRYRVCFPLLVVSYSLLAISIEFAQIFFPPRTTSINDILAETIGGTVGTMCYLFLGEQFEAWVRRLRAETRVGKTACYVLTAYVAAFAIYELMPFDLFISPAELFRKWRDGRVIIVPFSYPTSGWVETAYQFGIDSLLWAPVCALALLGLRLRPLAGVALTAALAFGIETAQLFVFSRVTDVTDVLAAVAGGVGVAVLWARAAPTRAQDKIPGVRGTLFWWLMFPTWIGVLMAVFWYPFNFTLDTRFISERLWKFTRLPFLTYYYGSEFNAITQVLRKFLFFMPLGVCVAGGLHRFGTGEFSRLASSAAALIVGVVALGIELGQLLLPGKVSDATDWGIATVGGLSGYFASICLYKRVKRKISPVNGESGWK